MAKQTDPISAIWRRAPRLPFQMRSRPFTPPRKALILQPCCLGRVMLTTPLLAALSQTYPSARFDWAVGDWARQAIGTNPRITRLIRTGVGNLDGISRDDETNLLKRIQAEEYDTCFIPDESSQLASIAWRASIPQRIGLVGSGGSSSYTIAVRPPLGERHLAKVYLALGAAAGVDEETLARVEMEFEPPDRDRAAIARWLVEELDWLGDSALVVVHPGGGSNPEQLNMDKRWPAERCARLANYLVRSHGARVVLVGLAEERDLATHVGGMMSFPSANLAGNIGLGELGALCELASLYVGNDIGSTYVAAATGCPTLAIYGPTDPRASAPYMVNGRVTTLWRPHEDGFSWTNGVTVEDATAAADELLRAHSLPVPSDN